MCESPNLLRDGQLVACRKCGQCRNNRIERWVGRCIAESKTVAATTSLTLTYGRDEDGNVSHERAAILTYSDVQKYFKQLRNRGFPCRYLLTGEHGSKKGRTHWHGIIFWLKDIPTSMLDYGGNSWHRAKRQTPIDVPIQWDTRFNEPCWVYGFSYWQPVSFGEEKGSITYACKYINKDIDDPAAQSKLAMSKKPPIGALYFIQRAQRMVDEGVSPQDPFYQFPGNAVRKNGNPINFQLTGKVLDIFCSAFITKWREQRGGHYPASEFLDDYEDRKLRLENTGEYQYAGGGRYVHHVPKTENLEVREWREKTDDLGVILDRQVNRLRTENRFQPHPARCQQSVWVEKMAERGKVFWLTMGLTSPGSYRVAKVQPTEGRTVWVKSLRLGGSRNSPA